MVCTNELADPPLPPGISLYIFIKKYNFCAQPAQKFSSKNNSPYIYIQERKLEEALARIGINRLFTAIL